MPVTVKFVHVDTHIPKELHRAFRRALGFRGATAKDVLGELIEEYVNKTAKECARF